MNRLYIFMLGLCFVFTAKPEFSFSQDKYSDLDFFNEVNSLQAGYHNLSKLNRPSYGFLPKLTCDKVSKGYFEVICFPKDLNTWQRRVKSIKDSLRVIGKGGNESKLVHPIIKRIATDKSFQNKFSIYAFRTLEKDVILESDLERKVRLPGFPSFVYIYKKEPSGWVLLNKVSAKNWSDWQTLKYNAIVPREIH